MNDIDKFIKAFEDADVMDGVIKMSVQFRDALVALLKEQPEIVMCGDCKYFNNHPMTHGLHYGECDNGMGMVNHDWFCADGERREIDAID